MPTAAPRAAPWRPVASGVGGEQPGRGGSLRAPHEGIRPAGRPAFGSCQRQAVGSGCRARPPTVRGRRSALAAGAESGPGRSYRDGGLSLGDPRRAAPPPRRAPGSYRDGGLSLGDPACRSRSLRTARPASPSSRSALTSSAAGAGWGRGGLRGTPPWVPCPCRGHRGAARRGPGRHGRPFGLGGHARGPVTGEGYRWGIDSTISGVPDSSRFPLRYRLTRRAQAGGQVAAGESCHGARDASIERRPHYPPGCIPVQALFLRYTMGEWRGCLCWLRRFSR